MPDWGSLKPENAWKRPEHAVFNTKSAKYVRKILTTVMNEEETAEYVHSLRVSSFPICGLLDAINRIEKPSQPIPFSMSFYTSIGTAVHENLQNRMVLSKRFGRWCFGNWKCTACNEIPFKQCLRPKSLVCPKCKSGLLTYHELDFLYKNVSGHLDMLTLDNKEKFVAWEFKTTSEYNIKNPLQNLPQLKHKQQIETYCTMLWRVHGIRVHTYVIVYISRNRAQMNTEDEEQFIPFTFKFTDAMMDRRDAQIERIRRSDVVIKKLFKEPDKSTLRKLEALRPCRSEEDYNDPHTGMKHAFYKGGCEFAKKGLCFRSVSHGTEAGMKISRLLKIK